MAALMVALALLVFAAPWPCECNAPPSPSLRDFPLPFSHAFSLVDPPHCEPLVAVVKHLVQRTTINTECNGTIQTPYSTCFDSLTSSSLSCYQRSLLSRFPHSGYRFTMGALDAPTAAFLLEDAMYDGYAHDHTYWPDQYQWRVHLPVWRDREIDSIARLQLRVGGSVEEYYFIAKTAGQQVSENDTNLRNELTFYGSTPSGLYSADYVSPLPPADFGPWPLQWLMQGMAGNAGMQYEDDNGQLVAFYPSIRNAIFIHTGYWDNWPSPQLLMPHSHGCIHSHPSGLKFMFDLLTYYNVSVHSQKEATGRGLVFVDEIASAAQYELQQQYVKAYLNQNNEVTNKEFVLGSYYPGVPVAPADPAGPNAGRLSGGPQPSVDPFKFPFEMPGPNNSTITSKRS